MRHPNSARYRGANTGRKIGQTIYENRGSANRFHWKLPCTAGYSAVILGDSQLRSIQPGDVPDIVLARYRGASSEDIAFIMANGYGPNINKPGYQHPMSPEAFSCPKCKTRCFKNTTLIIALGTNDLMRKRDSGAALHESTEFIQKWAEANKMLAVIFADIPNSRYFDTETQEAVKQYRNTIKRRANQAKIPTILQDQQNWVFEADWVHVTPRCANRSAKNLQRLIP